MNKKIKIHLLFYYPITVILFMVIKHFNLQLWVTLLLLPIILGPSYFLIKKIQLEWKRYTVYSLFILEILVFYLII
ncbi:uncharacterized protein YqhQ [Bacillus luteolus]|nr:uncharacterized protein YqhQ [Cytobacillus luteolus]